MERPEHYYGVDAVYCKKYRDGSGAYECEVHSHSGLELVENVHDVTVVWEEMEAGFMDKDSINMKLASPSNSVKFEAGSLTVR